MICIGTDPYSIISSLMIIEKGISSIIRAGYVSNCNIRMGFDLPETSAARF